MDCHTTSRGFVKIDNIEYHRKAQNKALVMYYY